MGNGIFGVRTTVQGVTRHGGSTIPFTLRTCTTYSKYSRRRFDKTNLTLFWSISQHSNRVNWCCISPGWLFPGDFSYWALSANHASRRKKTAVPTCTGTVLRVVVYPSRVPLQTESYQECIHGIYIHSIPEKKRNQKREERLTTSNCSTSGFCLNNE